MVKKVWNWCDIGVWFGASQCCRLWAPHLPVSTQLPIHTCELRRPDAPASTFSVKHRGGRPWWKSGRWGKRGSCLFPFMGTCTSAHSKSRGDWGWLQLAWGSVALGVVSGALPPGLSEQGQSSTRGHCGLVSRGSAAVGGMWAAAQRGSALALICHRVFVLRLHLCPLSLLVFKCLPHLYN